MRFCGNARRVRFVAQSSKYPRYVFDCAPRGHRRAFSAKIFDRRGGRFFVFSRRQDAEILEYFKDDNAVKRKISRLCGALYSDCIVYIKTRILFQSLNDTLLLAAAISCKPQKRNLIFLQNGVFQRIALKLLRSIFMESKAIHFNH